MGSEPSKSGHLSGPRLRPGLGLVTLVSILAAATTSCAEDPEIAETRVPRPPVEARATVDRAVATTGDLITYRVEVDSEPGYEVEIPQAGAEIAGFRIVDVGQEQPVEKAGRVVQIRWYQLRADLVGSYVLPPIEVGYRQRAAEGVEPGPWQPLVTSEIFVEVESVLATHGEASDIMGLKPLRDVRAPFRWWLVVTFVLVAAILFAWLAWYLRRRAGRRDLTPPIPAHELAFAALSRLRSTDFSDPEAVRFFYFQISEVIRNYVEGRFGVNATDLTTEEILESLVFLEDLEGEQGQRLAQFLIDTDQVKFAHREPSTQDIESTYEEALGFVETTQPTAEVAEEKQAA